MWRRDRGSHGEWIVGKKSFVYMTHQVMSVAGFHLCLEWRSHSDYFMVDLFLISLTWTSRLLIWSPLGWSHSDKFTPLTSPSLTVKTDSVSWLTTSSSSTLDWMLSDQFTIPVFPLWTNHKFVQPARSPLDQLHSVFISRLVLLDLFTIV